MTQTLILLRWDLVSRQSGVQAMRRSKERTRVFRDKGLLIFFVFCFRFLVVWGCFLCLGGGGEGVGGCVWVL